ncbi:MAG TPA: hypothetical protein VGF69_08205 [Thermoanaerobaculia bacterium]
MKRPAGPVSSWLRCLIASTLVLISAMTAVVPHRHGLTDGLRLASGDGSAFSGVKASRDHTAQVPCAACAREHHDGVAPSARHTAAPRTQPVAIARVAVTAEAAGHDANVRLRGPPSAMSVC